MLPIKGYERYLINDRGIILNSHTGRELKHAINKKGYHFIVLSKNGYQKNFMVSRLVYQTFSGYELHSHLEVNHIDGNKDNNHISNLELITHHENVLKAVATGNIKSGFACHRSRPVDQIDVMTGKVIRKHGSVSEAGRFMGKNPSLISLAASGKRKTIYGFKWKFSELK